ALRYFNVFGPRQDPHSQYAAVVPKFISSVATGEAVPIYGDGRQSRDFTYVANVVEANLLAAEADGVSGAILNVATGDSSTVDDPGLDVRRSDELHRDISPVRDTIAALKLARLIRQERPQILHTHTAKAGAVGRLAALLSGRARPPIVVHTFHGHVLRGYFDPIRTAGFRLLERLLARTSTALVAVSPQVRDDLVALGVAPRERFVVVRLGIELAQRVTVDGDVRGETRRVPGIAPDRFVVGRIGRM